MDIEQLKLILEAVSNASGDAKEVVVWYLAATAIPTLVNYLLTFAAVVVIAKMSAGIVNGVVRATNVSYAIAREIGTPVSSPWFKDDTDKVFKRLGVLLDKEKLTQ